MLKQKHKFLAICGGHCREQMTLHKENCATGLHMAERTRRRDHEHSRLIGPAGAATAG